MHIRGENIPLGQGNERDRTVNINFRIQNTTILKANECSFQMVSIVLTIRYAYLDHQKLCLTTSTQLLFYQSVLHSQLGIGLVR